MEKYIYSFDEENADSDLLGLKGTRLVTLTSKNLPVPHGFIITKEAYKNYHENNERLSREIEHQILEYIKIIETKCGKKVGDKENPLFLAVRLSPTIEIKNEPKAILNIGLNDNIAANMAIDENSAKFIYDTYRKLIMTYATTVKSKDEAPFKLLIDKYKEKRKVKNDLELTAEDLFQIAAESKKIYKKLTGENFPKDPICQLLETIKYIFKTWDKQNKEINDLAIIVQQMVFGNINNTSLQGTVYSRDNITGEDKLSGIFLRQMQEIDFKPIEMLIDTNIDIYKNLDEYSKLLEYHYKDIVQIDFIVENSKLYIIEAKKAKKSEIASINIAVSMAEEGLITKEEAIMKINPDDLDILTYSSLNKKNITPLTSGKTYNKGAFSGPIYFDIESAKRESQKEDIILVKKQILPEDAEYAKKIKGIITVNKSDIDIFKNDYGKCYITECKNTVIDEKNKIVKINGKIYEEGSYLSIDDKYIYEGQIEINKPKIDSKLITLLSWAKDIKQINIASVIEPSKKTIDFGIDTMGICRVEDLIFESAQIFIIKKLILSKNIEEINRALKELLPILTIKFEEVFKNLNGKQVAIKLLDTPLRSFLPKSDEEIYELSKNMKAEIDDIKAKIKSLQNFNSIIDLHGSPFAVTYPEIVKMETEAILKAAINVKRKGYDIKPGIVVPVINDIEELKYLKEIINITKQTLRRYNIDCKLGTMIETPRNVALASNIAKEVDFLIIDSYKLTKYTYGIYDDDLKWYYNNVLHDPFTIIDEEGLGKFMTVTSKLAYKSNPNIILGVSGPHGENEKNIKIFEKIGIDYLICKLNQIPKVTLIAARAELNGNK